MGTQRKYTALELADAVSALQAERNELLTLLHAVAGSVLDKAPDGMAIAYLSARTLADIRQRVHN